MEHDIDTVVETLSGMLERYNTQGIAITGETNLASELNVDSVEVMDLIMEIEEKFDVDIPINLLADVERVQDLAGIVCARMKDR